ncbi:MULTISPECIES: hypothetical protein [Pirellulaceae]|nr:MULTISPECIES: hypothetical protein [Pirellulaceae]
MQFWSVIGWGLLFVGIAFCAFVVDRDRSIRDQRNQEARSERKRRTNRFSWRMVTSKITQMGTVAWALLFVGLIAVGLIPFIVPLVLITLLGLSVGWFVQDLIREGKLWRKTKHTVRSLGFGLRHMMAFLTILGVTAGVVRARYPQASITELALTMMFFTVIVSLLVGVAYLGVDTLLFGRGSGRRANRLREIEKRREDEDFS